MGEVKYHTGWKHYIRLNKNGAKQVALSPDFKGDEWSIWLQFHPGDTMSQARSLYKYMRIEKLLQLQGAGWKVYPNFHFSYQASNLVYPTVKMDVNSYIDYWIKNVDLLKQIQRADFTDYFTQLQSVGIISSQDWNLLNEKIINKKYPNVNVCPGLSVFYYWSYKEAIEKDEGTGFVEVVREKINEALNVWE